MGFSMSKTEEEGQFRLKLRSGEGRVELDHGDKIISREDQEDIQTMWQSP